MFRAYTLSATLLAGSILGAQDPARMKQTLEYLASRELLGRESGQPGCVKAATYLAGKMQAIGLQTITGTGMGGETPYHYTYTLSSSLAADSEPTLELAGVSLQTDRHFRSHTTTQPNGKAVFVGYGMKEDTVRRDVKGNWVMVLEGHPDFQNEDAVFRPEATLEAKIQNARNSGARGLILLTEPPAEGRDPAYWNRVSAYGDRMPRRTDFPVITLTPEGSQLVDRDLFARDTATAILLGTSLDVPALSFKAQGLSEFAASSAANVVGLIPGTDSILKNEYLLVCGHYDHIGGTSSSYYPGADDNASGTSGLMELAQLLVTSRPKRSILFVAMSGEEKGLLGSAAFASKCPIPLSSVVGVVNLDMLGRNATRTVYVTPAAVSGQVNTLVKKARELALNKAVDLSKGIDQYWQQSDHYSFATRGIPVIFFNSGTHSDLHQTTDTPDKIDYEKMVRIVDLAKDLVAYFANSPEKPTAVASSEYNAWNWPVKGNTTPTFSLTSQPKSISLAPGATASFSVTASGGKTPYTYQWYKGSTIIPGATSATYSFTAQIADSTAQFKVALKDSSSPAQTLNSTSATLTVTQITQTEKMLNGGFESGTTNWSGTTSAIGNWSGTAYNEPAFEGQKAAFLGGKGRTTTETLYQAIAIPSTATKATLSFYLHIDTKESGTTVYDKLAVQIRNSSGTLLKTLTTYSNANAANGYQARTFDLTAYKGQTVRVHFNMTEDQTLATNFLVDKVSLIVQ